jgi:hypothetical protein
MSEKELKEFAVLERTLNTLAAAPAEDREIRLKELEQIEVGGERLRTLKQTCLESYRSFIEAMRLLDQARAETMKTEAAVAEVRAGGSDGGPLTESQRERIMGMSEKAASSLGAVNESLDKAEKLVDSCDKARAAMRAMAESSM